MVMRNLVLAVAVVLSAGCLSGANKVGTATTVATLACDYGQTLWHAKRGWGSFEENNMILGTAPSPTAVTTYFVTTTAVVLVGAALLPKWMRPGAYSAVTLVQADAIYGNVKVGTPMCGL
jgi:hypothetical protein